MSKLKQKGQGLVEFALILPLLLLMFFGIVEFGRIFQAYMTVQHAAREAARYAVTGQPGGSDADRVHAIKARALEAMAGVNVDYSRIDWRECGCGTSPGCLYPTCPMDAYHWQYENPGDLNNANALLLQVYGPDGENDPGGPGQRVHVRVMYNLQTLTPFFSSLFPSIQLTGRMEMINEGFGVTGASHGGVLPPTLEPIPEMGPYASDTEFTDSTGYTSALGDAENHQYNLGDFIFVTVTDKDENFYLDQADTVTAVVSDTITGDREELTLTEVGANAGVFRNTTGLSSAVASGSITPNNGVLETRAGYTIIAIYTDNDDSGDVSSDPARMTGAGASTTRFTDNGGVDETVYAIGGDIFVTVDDSDEAGTVTVTVTVASGDVETLTLTETGTAGVFRNTLGLATNDDSISHGNNTLQVRHCDTVTASYVDDDDSGDTSSDTATMMYTDSEGSVAFDRDEYYINVNLIFVDVRDDDENENCLAPDQVTVTVENDSTGDSETLTLNETGANTGIFRNTAGLSSGPNSGGTPGNSNLEAQGGNEIRVTYRDNDDAGDTRTDTAFMRTLLTSSITSFTNNGGTDVSVYNLGVDGIYVTVQDSDENISSSTADTVSVTVTDTVTGDRETLTLTETGFNTGVFRNTTGLQSITGTVSMGDDVLQTQPGNTITVNYADDNDPSDTGYDTALMGMMSTTRFTDNGGVDVIQYAIGVDGIYVTVTDSDENVNSGSAEQVTVTITDSVTGDSETLTLTETGANTGIFRNTTGLTSSSSSASSGNGILNTASGSTITARYVDKDGATDTSSDTATMVVRTPSATFFTNNLGAEQDEYYLGTQLIYVTVTDADENLNPSVVETVFITVTDSQTGDSERLTLYETGGANTGVFRGGGLASTQSLVGVPNNNLLETQPGNTITASYTDDDDGTDTSFDTALMRASDRPPDLVVTSITVGGSNLTLGDQTTITVTVRNQNMGSVTSTLFDVDFYIYTSPSNPPVPGRPGDAKQWYTENVAGGTEIQLVYPITLTQAGTLYLYAQADTTGRVAEADETNNIYRLDVPVTIDVACDALFSDDGDSVVAPGWTTDVREGSAAFARVEHSSDSGGVYYHSPTHAWWVDDPAWGLETYLISPQIPVPSGLASVTLRFWHRMRAEVVTAIPYDGGWLQYNLDNLGFSDVTAASGMIVSGGYNGQLPDNVPTPRHEAWTGTISWQEVVVNIPIADTTQAHTIQFRWHFEANRSSGALSTPPRRGWWIDDVTVSGCEGPSPPLPPGSQDCDTAFQDSFSGTLSQWSVSDASYVYISSTPVPGRLRLRVVDQQSQTHEEWARTAQNINLSGYDSVTLSYSWWTEALDTGEWGQVRISNNGGSSWTTVATYYGTNNGSASIPLSGGYLTDQFRMEFRVRANRWQQPSNYERFEVDNVVLEACDIVDPPDPVPGTGNIFGHTFYENPSWPVPFPISGVNIWATQVDPAGDTDYTYSLDDYSYGFWNLPVGRYNIYADIIIDNQLYTDLITDVLVGEYSTTAVDIYVTY